jgi:hypothetical protein
MVVEVGAAGAAVAVAERGSEGLEVARGRARAAARPAEVGRALAEPVVAA